MATATALVYALVALGLPEVTRRLPSTSTAVSTLRVRYPDGRGVLRDLLREATSRGFTIDDFSTELHSPHHDGPHHTGAPPGLATVEGTLHVRGKATVDDLAVALAEMDGIEAVVASDVDAMDD